MEPKHVKPGAVVKQRQNEHQMAVLWVEADDESVRCRWLARLEWKDALCRVDELELIGPPPPF